MITTQIVYGHGYAVCTHCGGPHQYGVRLGFPWNPAYIAVLATWHDHTWVANLLRGTSRMECVIRIPCLNMVASALGIPERVVRTVLERYRVLDACHTVYQYIRADAQTPHDALQAFVHGTIAEHAFGQALLACGVSRECLAQWTRDAAADPHGFWGSVQDTLYRMYDRLVYVHTRSYVTSTEYAVVRNTGV